MLEGSGRDLAGLQLGLVEVGGDVLRIVASDGVGDLDALDGDVAVVLNGDLVGDRVAQRVALLRLLARGDLGDLQARVLLGNRRGRAVRIVLVASGDGVLALRDLRGVGVLRVGDRVALGGHGVGEAALKDVGLGDHVRGGEDLLLAHCQGRDGLVQVGSLVVNLHVGVGGVALVLDGDLVLDGLAQLEGLAVCRRVGDGLVDGQRGVEIASRLGVGARSDGNLGLVGIGAGALGGGLVHDLAGQDVGLGHDVGTGGRRRLARSKRDASGLLASVELEALQLVLDGDVRDGQVAVVLNRDLVGDGRAKLVATLGRRRRGDLVDGQVTVLLLGGLRINARLDGNLGLIRIGTRALRGCNVHNLAGQDIVLGHDVRSLELLGSTRCHRGNLPRVLGQLVGNGNVGNGQVAVVGDNDLVGDGLTQSVLAVGGSSLGSGLLGNGDVAVLLSDDLDEVRARDLIALRVIARNGCNVGNLASVNVVLCHGIGVGVRLASARSEDGRGCVSARNQRIAELDARHSDVAVVGDLDGVGDDVAKLDISRLVCGLLNAQLRVALNGLDGSGSRIDHHSVERINTSGGNRVVEGASIHVVLRDHVLVGNFLLGTRSEVEGILGELDARVGELDARDSHVAVVGDGDGVGNGGIHGRTGCRVRNLLNAQAAVGLLGGDGELGLAGDLGAERVGAGGGHGVVDLAGVNVGLGDGVLVGGGLLLVRGEVEGLLGELDERVLEGDALDGHVAGVLHGHGVGDLVAGGQVGRLVGGLGDVQSAVGLLGGDGSGGGNLSRILTADSSRIGLDSVHDLASVDVCLRDLVGVSELLLCARCQLEGLLAEVSVVI